MGGNGRWVTATDLADYAYCPRSHWYHDHPPVGGTTRESQEGAAAGARYHHRTLGAERRREEHGSAYWVAFLVGLLLVVGGVAWILRP
jgi:CRISPR/Cas system-associated exonuclease Cas4 (RecB family)